MEESRQLLVVSNTHQYRQWAAQVAEEGWVVLHSQSVAEGMARCSGACKVVLLDLASSPAEYLPVLIEQYSDVFLIPVLGDDDLDMALYCFRAGCFDVLKAPVTFEQVEGMLRRIMEGLSAAQNIQSKIRLERANRGLRDNLKMLELDLKAGRQVQLSMLPDRKRRYGEYEIAYDIVPSLYLSGDFVGHHVVFDRYLLFYLADVSGHGASSAFITILLRFLLNRIVRRHVNNNDRAALARAPEGFLEHINRQIIELNVDKHLTIFSASIDMQTNLLRYSVGAHVPTPIFMAEGDARFLPGKGKPIGIFDDVTWEVQEIALPKKFILTATSDGVLEFVQGDSMAAKLATMIDAVAHSDYSLENICTRLGITGVKDAPDDITVLTVKRGL